jgi:hypothetical protein
MSSQASFSPAESGLARHGSECIIQFAFVRTFDSRGGAFSVIRVNVATHR